MDTGDTLIDPEAEVKKLQDLVKKLEKQNEVLRSRQKHTEPVQNGDVEHGKLTINHNNNLPETLNIKGKAVVDSEDDDELVDIDKLAVKDEEDSWLYSSPKPPTPLQNRVSPYKWVRKEFDHPSPEVESVKKSLLHKLEEAARMSRSCSTPVFGSYSTPRSYTQMSYSADSTPVYSNKPVTRKSLATSFGSSIGMGNKVDTGTFTRPKKSRAPVNTRPANTVDETDSRINPNDSKNHPNVSDIENLAKLQEESLRQSLSQSSPRRGERHLSQSNSIGSDNGSPPDSPNASSQYLNHYNNNQENTGLRRSFQNVSRLPQTSGQYGSDPYLDNYSSGGSDDYEQNVSPKPRQISRLQPPNRSTSPYGNVLRQPTGGQRGTSPQQNTGIPRGTSPQQPAGNQRGSSPQRTGLPQPSRRTIPRPDGNSRLATPVRRSGLPAPRSSISRLDDSWKEGCF